MNSPFTLLTSFRGRISRKQWWLGNVIVCVASVLGTVLFNAAIFTAEEVPPPNWLDTFWQLAWLIPATAITVKRFNDRDWPWRLGYAFGSIGFATIIAPHFGVLIAPPSDGIGAIVFWVTFAVIGLAFIDNGFIQGPRGPNRYGPDPLTGA